MVSARVGCSCLTPVADVVPFRSRRHPDMREDSKTQKELAVILRKRPSFQTLSNTYEPVYAFHLERQKRLVHLQKLSDAKLALRSLSDAPRTIPNTKEKEICSHQVSANALWDPL